MASFSWFVVVAIALLVAPAMAQYQCSTTINGQKYDLTSLRSSAQDLNAGNFRVYYQPCAVTPCGTYQNTAMCQKFTVGVGGYSIGDMGTAQYLPSQRGDKGFQLKFTAENGRINTKVDFICDPNFVGVGSLQPGPSGAEPTWNNFHFQWTSSYACPISDSNPNGDGGGGGGGDDGGLAGGWIFIIVLGCVTIVYFAGGYAFNRFYRKEEGIENQIPQYAFWVSLPGLVKDGCLYTYRKVAGLVGGGSSGYSGESM